MATYMVQFKYTEEGLKGLVKDGGSKRREATERLVKSLGGKLVEYYFAFGEYDGILIMEGIDNVEATAAALIGAASGAVQTKTTVLLTPKEIDKAVEKAGQKSGDYRPPGA